jgi:ribosome-associated toxin RatA of RatAB toxin-antitoxin module
MREVQHSALIAQTPAQVFALINDIESYPQFIPWCKRASVQSRSEREIIATLGVQRGPLQGEFTTRNELETDRRILMHLMSGPFRMLEGEWLLSPIPADARAMPHTGQPAGAAAARGGCRVQLTMKFAFSNPLTAVLFEQKFAETVSSLVDAFVARARALPS